VKLNLRTLTTLLLVIAALAIRMPAQDHTHYRLIDLGTFGGPQSYLYAPNNYAALLNNRGKVTGWAETTIPDPFLPNFCYTDDCVVAHAFQSQNGRLIDLGALQDGFSSSSGWISSNGLIAGWSESGQTDPTFFAVPVIHGVVWRNGAITDLGTLDGGYESAALAVNSRGQVVGVADNGIPDATALSSDLYGWNTQTRAILWQDGAMQDLGTLGGTDAVALLVNERGQVVGASYEDSNSSAYCANLGSYNTTGAFLWDKGKMTNLGSFGGTCTFPQDLNNRGEVVGLSTVTGDQFQHAFLWKHGGFSELPNSIGGNNSAALALNEGGVAAGFASLPGDQQLHAALWKNGAMTDLGSIDGDLCSNGFSINSTGQVVGVSVPTCDFLGATRAFLWENGSIADLNALIPSGSPLYLAAADTINDRGEIAGVGLDGNLKQHAFLLIPCSRNDDECQGAAGYSAFPPTPNTTRPGNGQKGLRRMFRNGSRLSGISSLSTPSARDSLVPIIADQPPTETPSEPQPASDFRFSSVDGSADDYLKDRINGFSPSRTDYPRRCTPRGTECPPQFPPCCPGLICAPASTRAFCL
jgi:probable HAF family extracellular repeat protein